MLARMLTESISFSHQMKAKTKKNQINRGRASAREGRVSTEGRFFLSPRQRILDTEMFRRELQAADGHDRGWKGSLPIAAWVQTKTARLVFLTHIFTSCEAVAFVPALNVISV